MKLQDPNHPQVAVTEKILDALDKLSPHSRVAFGASCAERLFPLYLAFSTDAGWGDPKLLRSAIDHLWDTAMQQRSGGRPFDPTALLSIGPSSSDHISPFTFGAQYAVSCVIHAQQAISTKTSDEAAWCSIVSRDCVYEYLQWVASPAYDDGELAAIEEVTQIDWFSHPLVEHEVRKQFADLRAISRVRQVDSRLVQMLCSEGPRGIDPFRRQLIHVVEGS